MRNSFVFYRSFKDSLSDLSDSDKLVVYEAIADYALDKTEPHLTGFPKALFLLIRPQLDANWKRYEAGEKHGYLGAEYGKLGGRPKKEKPSRNPLETLYEPSNVNVNVNDNVNKEDCKGKKSKVFIPPSLSDIQKFITENHYSVIPDAFLNFYQSNGWLVGKNKMKDWQAAVRTWEAKNKKTDQNEKQYIY